MAIDADEWQTFYERSREVMGSAWAATLVKAIPPAGADALVTKDDLTAGLANLRAELHADMAELRGGLRTEMAELRGDLRTEMAELRGEVRTEVAGVRTEIADLGAAVEAKLRGQTWRLSGLLVGTLGIGITLARLA